MTDEEIVKRAKDAEKRTGFGELVHSPISKGVNSAYGIGYIEGMVEYRNSLQEEPVSEELDEEIRKYLIDFKGYPHVMDEEEKNMIKMARHFANWQKQQMIDKACEWLKYYISYDDFGGNMEWLVPFENDECMIQHFKTYMEG